MSTALDLKNKANELFQQKRFAQAIEVAFAYLRVESYGAAIQDATNALNIDPKYAKAYYRRGSAYANLGKYKGFLICLEDALQDFRTVQKLLPRDQDAATKVKECEKIIRQKAFEEAIAVPPEKPISELVAEELKHMTVDSSYTGPHLPERVTPEWVRQLMAEFAAQRQIHRKYLYEMLIRVKRILEKEPTMLELQVPEGGKLTVFGDIHGQYYDLMNILSLSGEPNEKSVMLFNGDFVDRGSFSCEVIITLFAWKLAFPEHVFLHRGNHETKNMNKIYGFEGEVKAKFSEKAYDLFCEVFCALPLCSTINNKIFVVHGGLFEKDGVKLEELKKIDRFREPSDSGLMSEMLWSDPQPLPGRIPSKRGVGIAFGPDVTERFLRDNDLELVVRSHEVKEEGYQIEHGGKLITVFSAPNYCDQIGNKGAFIVFTPDLQREIKTYSAVPHPPVKPMAYAGLGGLLAGL